MFDLELWHWEILRVPRRETRACADGGGRDQAVGLRQRDPPLGEISAPVSGTCSLRSPEGSEMQAAQQAHGGVTLVLAFVMYAVVEKPIRHSKALASRPWVSIAAGLALVLGAFLVATLLHKSF